MFTQRHVTTHGQLCTSVRAHSPQDHAFPATPPTLSHQHGAAHHMDLPYALLLV